MSLEILGLPDTAQAFEPLRFRIRYNTNGRLLRLNVAIRMSPSGEVPLSVSHAVRGAGERFYKHRVPDHRRASGFYVTAYLTRDGTWNGIELFVSSKDSTSAILAPELSVSWKFDAPQSATLGQAFTTSVTYACEGATARNFPYLVVDLVDPEGAVAARHLEWSAPEKRTYTHTWRLPRTVRAPSLRLVARLESDGADPLLPPLAHAVGPEISLEGHVEKDYGRVSFSRDTLLVNGRPAFLHGVNISSFWNAWDDATIRREIRKIGAAGLSFIRVYLDWTRFEPRPGVFSDAYRHSIAVFLETADSLGILVEPVPVGNWGGWNYELYRDHWWTSRESREANARYFREFGRWLDSLDVSNILYVSVMQEGSWNFDWYDPLNGHDWGIPYPGPGAIAEADSDWASWLEDHGRTYETFAKADPEVFGRWASERFADLLFLRAQAFREGSRYRFAVGAEGVGGSVQYDRRLKGKHVSFYGLPELWAHVVDCIEIHSYTPFTGDGYWSGSTGLRTFLEWMEPFNKPHNVGETNWMHANERIDMSDTETAWPKLREKLEYIRALGYTGYAIWAWMDYDRRKLGLLDSEFRPRPVLDSLSAWIAGTNTSIADPRSVPRLLLEQNYPNPFGIASRSGSPVTIIRFSIPGRSRAGDAKGGLPVRLEIFDLLGRRVFSAQEKRLEPGRHEIRFRGTGLPSGMYVYRLEAGRARAARTMVVLN